MLDNTVTLSVDEQNDGVGPVNHVYTRFDESQNRTTYIHSTHTLSAKDTLTFYRTLPKPSGNFKGVAKSATKFSKEIAVLGVDGSNITSALIVEVSISLPVGATAAQAMIARQKVVSLMDLDAVMVPAMEQQMV